MQYFVSVIHDSNAMATDEEMAAITEFNKQLQADGYWVFAGGLGGTDMATTIDNREDEAVVTDGPYIESKEYVVGVWIWEAPDLDVALKLAEGASKACNRKIEVRPFL